LPHWFTKKFDEIRFIKLFNYVKYIKKKRCWGCKSLDVIRWGRQQNKQRFKCKTCGLLFSFNRPFQRINNRFIWFKKWILERQTYTTLSRDSGYSKSTLQRTFYCILERSPVLKIKKNKVQNIRMDATYFEKFCLVCYQNNEDGYIQLIRFTNGEHYSEIKEDLSNLIKLGLQIESITVDGHKSILKAIKESVPGSKIQRCLVHIQRMCLIWLTQYPKHIAGQELKRLILLLLKVKTNNDKVYWVNQFNEWYVKHKEYINEKTYQVETGRFWYTHKLLRRSYSTIKSAMPNMFHYLQNSNIPHTTNGIESFFGHLKNHLDLHRGLTLNHRINFIKWYIYFSNNK
jgi:hypothetical protein